MQAINRVAMQMDFDEAYDGLREVCLRLLGCEKATLFLLDERNKELRCCFA